MVSVGRYVKFVSGSLVGRVLMVTAHALNGVSVCIYMHAVYAKCACCE